MMTLASLPNPVLIPYIVRPSASAASTASRLAWSRARARASTATVTRGSRATRTTSAIDSDRPSSWIGFGMGPNLDRPAPPHKSLRLAARAQLRIVGIGLERPLENRELRADVCRSDRPIEKRRRTRVRHLEDVANPGESGGTVGGVVEG